MTPARGVLQKLYLLAIAESFVSHGQLLRWALL